MGKHNLCGDPLPWLLEPENPSVCYWALTDLLGRVLPAQQRSPQSEQVVRRLANALLDADYDFAGEHKRWLTFGVPRVWDLLSALKALAAHGYAGDVRFAPLLQLILDRQDEQGRWLCGSVSRTWPLERRNRPSKWVTLDALRVLRHACAPHLAAAVRQRAVCTHA